jgi:hypothetical protein
MGHRSPVVFALALALGLAVATEFASPVSAANNWSIAASPTELTVGEATDVTLTVIPGNQPIMCVMVSVPSGFTVLSVSVASAPGASWTASKVGAGPTLATFATDRNQDQLHKASAKFVIRVIATRSPLTAWTPSAYGDFPPCSHPLGRPVRPLPPFKIAPVPAPPSPSIPPRATVTPRPLPSILPPGATAVPTEIATPSAAPQPSPSSSTAGGVGPGGSGGAAAGGGVGAPIDVRALPAGGAVQIDVSAMGAMGMFAWVVPGLFLSLPGLLLVLIVLAQAGFATAFVPIIRRLFGVRRRSRALGRPMSSG